MNQEQLEKSKEYKYGFTTDIEFFEDSKKYNPDTDTDE